MISAVLSLAAIASLVCFLAALYKMYRGVDDDRPKLEDNEYFELSGKSPEDLSEREAERLLQEKEPDFDELEDLDV